jgi:hypothetical protein
MMSLTEKIIKFKNAFRTAPSTHGKNAVRKIREIPAYKLFQEIGQEIKKDFNITFDIDADSYRGGSPSNCPYYRHR